MRPYVLAENNWKDIKNRPIDLAVLPWEATEAHNYHLPYSADVIESENISISAKINPTLILLFIKIEDTAKREGGNRACPEFISGRGWLIAITN